MTAQKPRLVGLFWMSSLLLVPGIAKGGTAAVWLTAPLEHLSPPESRSPEIWNRLSEDQLRRGNRMEQTAPGTWRIRFGQPEKFTPTRFQEHPPCLKAIAALPPCARLPIRASAISFKTSGRGCALELPLEADEQLYGLGMNLKVFRLMNGKKTIRVSDDQRTDLGDSHAPVPFYVSTRGYGVFVDTSGMPASTLETWTPSVMPRSIQDRRLEKRSAPAPRNSIALAISGRSSWGWIFRPRMA